MRIIRNWIVCSLMLGWLVLLPADARPPAAEPVSMLSGSTWILEDAGGRLDYDAVRGAAMASQFVRQAPNFGIVTSAYWLRLPVRNPNSLSATFWLDLGNRTAQEVDVYYTAPDGQPMHMLAGSRFPFYQRPLPTDSFVFPLDLAGNAATDVYVRVRSTGYLALSLAPALWQPDAFRAHEESVRMQWFAYLGMAGALGLFNLMLWIYQRDALRLWYVLSLVTMVVAVSTASGGLGSAYRMFWPDLPLFEQSTWVGCAIMTVIFPLGFVARLTGFSLLAPRLYRAIAWGASACIVVVGFQVVVTLLAIPEMAATLQNAYRLGSLLYIPLMSLAGVSVFYAVWRKATMARFVLLAYAPLLVMAVFLTLRVVAGQSPPLMGIMWSAAFELLVMALALAYRVQLERNQKLAAERKLVETLRRSEQELEQKVLVRTLELNLEQQRTKALLYNILPVELAEELSATGHAHSARHESATVLFTDFAGFTAMAASMPADRMIAELNDIFAAFDDIADACGVEKIKTIGDAYMAAAGLPKPCEDHAQRCVRAGLKMIAFIEERNRRSPFKWSLRVGIHSGPVVSGVVGKRKYAFDIWGDTVNIASRMESAGEGMRVNVSAYTSDLAKDEFECEYRGKVAAKGKGEIDMYFVKCADKQPPAHTGTIST